MADTDKTSPSVAEDYSKYLIHSKKEIQHILRAVMQQNELVSAHFDHGKHFMLTAILAVDPERDALILDYGPEEVLNRRILESDKILFVTSQDRVKVQFAADRIEATRFGDRPAFQVKLPASLLKLQRREYYRLDTPIAKPLKCIVPLEGGLKVELPIVDISIGGIGVVVRVDEFVPRSGAVFQGCRFDLPDIGTIVTALETRTVFDVVVKGGVETRRVGFQFVNLPNNMQSMVQRYIVKLERERRALLADRD
jgi:c-di-GMP-binding flagellar brake protein YcgR